MRKVLIVLSMLVCSVSGVTAQATLQSKTKVAPGLTDSIPGYKNGVNVNFSISDIYNLSGARAEVLTNKTQSGLSNTFSNIPQSAVVNLVNDLAGKALVSHTHPGTDIVQTSNFRFASDAEKAIWNGKLSNITGFITGNGISAGSGTSGNPYVIPGGLGDPGANGLVKRTSLNNSTPAIAGADFQAPLISGTNIRTVNGQSLLGSTDLVITGGTGSGVTDGDKGDVTISGAGATYTVDPFPLSRLTQTATHRTVNDTQIAAWDNDLVGGGASASYTTQAYTTTANINFAGNHLEITNVTGNITLTATNKTPGASKYFMVNKTTANPIVISIDQSTLSAPSMKPFSQAIIMAEGSPPTITISGPAGGKYIFGIVLQGASMIPDFQIYPLSSENAAVVNANYNTLFTPDFTVFTTGLTTAETILKTIPIPANTLKAGSYLKIEFIHGTGFVVNSSSVITRVRIGTTGITSPIFEDVNNTNAGWLQHSFKVKLVAQNSQRVQLNYLTVPENHNEPVTRSVNFAQDQNIYITLEKTNANNIGSVSDIIIEAGGL